MIIRKPDFSDVQSGSDSGQRSGIFGRPDFSDVKTGSSTAPGNGGTGAQTHTVARGDTLSHIAQKFYGNAGNWQPIFDANRDQLDDPDKIRPGQVLRIPAPV